MSKKAKADSLNRKALQFQRNMIEVCIPRIEEIIERFKIQECKKEIEELKELFDNPELKIAVIGDFNTGKSTFINALLKDQTLSTAGIPTTVIPTYIRWNGRKKDPVIKIKFFDDDKEYSFDRDHSVLQKKLGFSFHNTKEGLEKITTNNDLIHIVECVHISYPYDKRFDHLCLIDTPGVNPGADETKEHAAITREVLQKQADTTIILFPADTMGRRSAFEYISDNAAHLVQDASFVITKIDIVEGDKSLPRFPELLKGFIKQHLKAEAKKVYTCSARYALAHFTGKLEAPEYAKGFEKMENELFADIQEKKTRMIQQKLTAIIQRILEKVQQETREQEELFSQELAVLERFSLENYHLESAEIQKRFEVDLERFCKIMNKEINSNLMSTQEFVLSLIQLHLDNCNGIVAIKDYASEGIKKDLKLYEDHVISKMKQDGKRINSKYQAFSKDIVGCLNKYQLNVSRIAQNGADVGNELTKADTKVDVSIDTDSIITGAVIAGILLLFINPLVLVAVIGAVVVGGKFILNAVKNRLLAKIKGGLMQANPRIIEEWEKTNERLKNECLVMSDHLSTDYEKQYRSIFEKKQADYLREKEELNADLAAGKLAERYLENINKAISLAERLDLFEDCPRNLLARFLDWDEEAMLQLSDYYAEFKTPEQEEKNDYFFSCIAVRRSGFVEYCKRLEQQDIIE